MREKVTMDVTLPRPNDLDGSSQLDEILSELLNETCGSPKKNPWSTDGRVGLDQQSGSITTQSGNSRTIISWQTSPAGPKKALTTTKQMNGLGRGGRGGSGSTTWDSQTLKTEGRSWKMEEETTERRLSEEEAVRRRQNAMSPSALHQLQREGGTTPRNKAVKTPPPPPARRRLISADELGVGMQSSCLASRGSRRSDGEEEPGRNHLMRNCASDSEETRSWLDEQRWKLETKRSGKTYQQHSRLEKQLITDLKSHLVSSGKYMDTTQSDTDTDQRLTMSPNRQQQQQQQQQGEEERAGRSTTSVRLNASSSHDDVSAKPPTSISTSSLRRGGQQTSDSEDLSPRDRTLSPRDRTLTRQTEDLSPRDRTLTRQSEEAVRYAGSYDDVIKATTFDLGISPEGTLVGRPRTAAAAAGRREPVRSMSLGDDPNRQKANYKTKASFFVSGIERPAFSTHQTKYTFSVSPLLLDQVESLDRNKPSVPAPPPRSSAPTSPLIPKRGDSSRQAVQRSQRKLVCSPTLDDLEQSLRLILEQTNQSPTDKEVQVLDKRKLTTPSREVVDDEVIILKPIGPGVQTLEPEKDGTLRRRPITPLIPLSVTNSQTNNDANKGPASPNWTSTDNVSSQQQQQQGQFNQQLGQSSQQLGQSSHQGQVNFQYSTETLRNAQPQQTTNMRNDVIMTDDQQLQQQLWLQQQQQQLLQQQQQLLLQQQQRLQQQQQQSWQQQQPSWQQPQQQSWQQQTWQRQQSWPLQQQQAQQPPVTMTPQSLGTLSRQQGVTPVNQVTATPLSQAAFETTQVVSRQELVQQPVTSYNMDTTTQMSQPLFIGVQKDQVSRDPQQGNTLHTQQHNQQQHVFVQSAQQLNAQQLNAQQLNAQQLNAQQLNALQLNAQQLNAQLMGSQQQMNPKQMGSYQTLPQVSMQQGVQQGVQQPVIVQQPIGVQQPISVQQRETAKYMTYEETLSSLPPQQVVVGQPQISGVQQMGLVGVQNQGQQVQQQMQQQVQQQMQQQQAYSQVLQSSSTLEHGSRNNTLPNGRQGITGGGGGGGVGGGSWTLDTRTRSPAPLSGGGMSPGGRWPSVGYNDTLQRSQTLQQQQQHQVKRTTAMTNSQGGTLMRTTSPSSVYSGQMGNGSVGSLTDGSEFTSTMPRFVRDTSKYWHKPNISRDEAINLLKDKPAGSFVVRNSTTFQGGYGLALKVAQLPPNVQAKGDDLQANLVRHFLIESSSKGVRLKGCSNEPVFGSLAQLVYQHSITPLALPCKLLLPGTDSDTLDETDRWNSDANLLTQGPACNALYVDSVDTESLTGPEALSKAIGAVFGSGSGPPKTTSVQFKVSYQGITLTDNKHRLFFRRHYPLNTVTFCGMDGKDRRWTLTNEDNVNISGKLFGFVARKSGGNGGNACHLFLDVDKTQSSASAIVGLVTKVMMGQGQFMKT